MKISQRPTAQIVFMVILVLVCIVGALSPLTAQNKGLLISGCLLFLIVFIFFGLPDIWAPIRLNADQKKIISAHGFQAITYLKKEGDSDREIRVFDITAYKPGGGVVILQITDEYFPFLEKPEVWPSFLDGKVEARFPNVLLPEVEELRLPSDTPTIHIGDVAKL